MSGLARLCFVASTETTAQIDYLAPAERLRIAVYSDDVTVREAIEKAARELFASHGFEKTTVREIGARAGIDPSMVMRYFGSKDALFAHVAEPDLQLPDLQQVDMAEIGTHLVRHFLDQWEGGGGGGMAVLLRSAASNDEAAERLQTIFRTQVFPAIARAGPPETAARRAGLVASAF